MERESHFQEEEAAMAIEKFPPDEELRATSSTASGPGGSGKDTSNTRARVEWRIHGLKQEEIDRLRKTAKVTKDGRLIVVAEDTRSLSQNTELAKSRAREAIAEARHKEAERIPTKPKKSAEKKRLQQKRRRGTVKETRRKPDSREW